MLRSAHRFWSLFVGKVLNHIYLMNVSNFDLYVSLFILFYFDQWMPNLNSIETADSSKLVSVGKRYTLISTHLFGIGEASYQLTVIGHQAPTLFEYLVDNVLMERNRLSFESEKDDATKTRLTWQIYSRRKSMLFRVKFFFVIDFFF